MADLGVFGNAIKGGLDALVLRQRVISNNIANIDTPGFRASEVQFEDKLQAAMQNHQGHAASLSLDTTAPGHIAAESAGGMQVDPTVTTSSAFTLRTDGNNVDIEQQMLDLSRTAIQFSALTRVAAMKASLLNTVATDGRR